MYIYKQEQPKFVIKKKKKNFINQNLIYFFSHLS